MGWNSWDAYGLTIDEDDYKANATVLAGLLQYGWQYAVIDEGWYMQNPFGEHLEQRKYVWDANGILIPAENRFPSSANGAGFKPLADWVHQAGIEVRHPYCARDSAPGGEGESAHCGVEFSRRGRSRHRRRPARGTTATRA